MTSRTPRSSLLAVVTTASVAGLLTACVSEPETPPPPQEEYAQVCTDTTTGERVSDERCETDQAQNNGGISPGTGVFLWYFLSSTQGSGGPPRTVPAIGEKVPDSTSGAKTLKTPPSEGTVYKGLPAKGGAFADSFSKASQVTDYTGGKPAGKPRSGDSNAGQKGKSGGFGGGRSSGGGKAGG